MKQITLFFLTILLLTFACADKPQPPEPDPGPPVLTAEDSVVSFLALGDSYTIGQSVDVEMRWPVQLADSLNARGWYCEVPVIIAKTGWTTDELDQGIDEARPADTFGLVSVLIGVNNQFRGRPVSGYVPEFKALLDRAITFASGDTGRVFVLSIPDYGATPFGQQRDPEKIAQELDEYNTAANDVCDQFGIPFFNITDISREATFRPQLIASDNLHPSGEMYRRWVERIRPEVEILLNK